MGLEDAHWEQLLKAWRLMAQDAGVDTGDFAAMLTVLKANWHTLANLSTIETFNLEHEIADLTAQRDKQRDEVIPAIESDIAAKQAELDAKQAPAPARLGR